MGFSDQWIRLVVVMKNILSFQFRTGLSNYTPLNENNDTSNGVGAPGPPSTHASAADANNADSAGANPPSPSRKAMTATSTNSNQQINESEKLKSYMKAMTNKNRDRLWRFQEPRCIGVNEVMRHTPLLLFDTIAQSQEQLMKRMDNNSGKNQAYHFYEINPQRSKLLNSNCAIEGDNQGQCIWRFNLFSSPDDVSLPLFISSSFDDSRWATMTVPSHWQLHEKYAKIDPPIYTNFSYPFKRNGKLSTAIPRESNPTGVYRTVFSLRFPMGVYSREINTIDENEEEKISENANANASSSATVTSLTQTQFIDSGSNDDYILIFQGAGSCYEVYVDDKFVGYHSDSFTEGEFNITDALDKSKDNHLLAVIVHRWSASSYLEDQDQWWYSGIHRNVILQRRRKTLLLCDYNITTLIDPGRIHMECKVLLPTLGESAAIRVTLYDKNNDVVATVYSPIGPIFVNRRNRQGASKSRPDFIKSPSTSSIGLEQMDYKPIKRKKSDANGDDDDEENDENRLPYTQFYSDSRHVSDFSMDMYVKNPRLWSAEDPYLYTAQIELIDITVDRDLNRTETVIQVELCDIGFREVQIINSQFLVNNKPVTICGVNRHEHNEERGKVISDEEMVKDILIMKQNNINAVRCCHYPNQHHWYSLCNYYGLYVCDEANIETHGFMLGGAISLLQHDKNFRDAFIARARNMIMRDRNYSCIVVWSLGNESGCGPNMRSCADLIRLLDKTRPIQYEGGIKSGLSPLLMGDGQDPITDIVCPMYHTPLQIKSYALDEKEKRPIILCEYGHMMGNSGGGLGLYWNLFRSKNYPSIQGGYIWDWVDQCLLLPKLLDAKHLSKISNKETSSSSSADDAVAGKGESEIVKSRYPLWGYGGDFGETSGKTDAQFCANGLVFANRNPHPCLFEARYLMQPVWFSLLDSENNPQNNISVEVENCYSFSSLDHVLFRYMLIKSYYGVEISDTLLEGKSVFADLTPGSVTIWSISLDNVHLDDESNSVDRKEIMIQLLVQAELIEDCSWAPKGHRIAYEAFDVTNLIKKRIKSTSTATSTSTVAIGNDKVDENEALVESIIFHRKASKNTMLKNRTFSTKMAEEFSQKIILLKMETDEAKNMLIVTSNSDDNGYEAWIDRKTGSLCKVFKKVSASANSEEIKIELISEKIQNCFYRACLDNDLGGADAHVTSSITKMLLPSHTYSYAGIWRETGLDEVYEKLVSFNVRNTEKEIISNIDIISKKTKKILFHVTSTLSFKQKCINLKLRVEASNSLFKMKRVVSLPRVGLELTLASELGENVSYLGNGPWENYPDRNRASKQGVYQTNVDSMYVPYLYPSENGGRSDVQWICFENQQKSAGILFSYKCLDENLEQKRRSEKDFAKIGDVETGNEIAGKRPVGTSGMQVSASRFSLKEIDEAKHQWEIQPQKSAEDIKSNPIHLHLDTAFMGVGGDVSWLPAVHPIYMVSPRVVASANAISDKSSSPKPSVWEYEITMVVV